MKAARTKTLLNSFLPPSLKGQSILNLVSTFNLKRSFSTLTKDLDGLSEVATECIKLEDSYGAHNYHPLPVVLSRGLGTLSQSHDVFTECIASILYMLLV